AGLGKRSLAANSRARRSELRGGCGQGRNAGAERSRQSSVASSVTVVTPAVPADQLLCWQPGLNAEEGLCDTAVPIIQISNLVSELPPPYTAIASPDASGVPVINCRVCQSLINLDGKLHQHVVKCTVCNEATPIKNPPSGKKYVRCQCNCLLICKDTSRKIGCPRPNCRRIITLGPVMLIPEEQPAQPALPVQPDGTRVVCGHCGNTFLWMELRFNTLAKCPHCKKM
ncbi:PREDICTED: type II phosphatidylinositol 4,5-bisphosphate 4-phosphatase-like, partial [Leptosomus discolor]|uniref:type II phosphatidylinositol 4,5-bisphosphate 4-phosphatase-like n=1 Tax=Leptosomus discolor TaxID=188344 RepID=UPI000522C21D